jgi:hypothetical protein
VERLKVERLKVERVRVERDPAGKTRSPRKPWAGWHGQ